MNWSKEELILDLKKIGVSLGCILHLKVSLRSIGNIEGGAQTLLDAVLDVVGSEGTVVVDAFVESYPLPLKKKHALLISDALTPSYAGAFANVFIKHPNVVRSKHPIQKFAAIGPKAQELVGCHTDKSKGYEVFETLCSSNAVNLSIGTNTHGVGTTHVAIEYLGFIKKGIKKGVNYSNSDGLIKTFQVDWNGGCSRGFSNFIPIYSEADAVRFGKIGNANAVFTSMKKTLELEIIKLKEDPSFFFCKDPTCKDCRLNWEHSSGNYWRVKYYSFLSIIKQALNLNNDH
ncbi:AAC(3) family N-acetyltransferase [Marinilabiliaceae bacterium N1Y90]|nr:AAC(3) family N-acetyltransferase [Marinilabiliaceae bacterium N1Y90]